MVIRLNIFMNTKILKTVKWNTYYVQNILWNKDLTADPKKKS